MTAAIYSGTAPDAAKIITDGAGYILDHYALQDTFLDKVREAFHKGVRDLAGADAERKLREVGLPKIHECFPTEKVLLLEDYVLRTLRDDLYYWSYRVGHDDLKLSDPFYIDHLIVIRIHYPHLVARRAKTAEKPGVSLSDVASHVRSALSDWRLVANQVSRAIHRSRKPAAYDPDAYHGKLVKPARSHGAHVDTWYGHSYDGINLWLSIDGVNVDNTVIVYPDMFGRPVPFDPVSMYLAPGTAVSKPVPVDLKPGQLLLFNPETLHGTQVNISDQTRLALTTRINPGQPRFNDEAPFNFEHWHDSRDLSARRFSALKVFPATQYRGEPSLKARPPLDRSDTVTVDTGIKWNMDQEVQACASDVVKPGTKVAVNFDNLKVLLWRDASAGIKAYLRVCPHLGIDLVDGYHDGNAVHCPGHGISFGWQEGTSRCSAFRLRAFDASERDGFVYLRKASGDCADGSQAGE